MEREECSFKEKVCGMKESMSVCVVEGLGGQPLCLAQGIKNKNVKKERSMFERREYCVLKKNI